jgi:hypothetical protein
MKEVTKKIVKVKSFKRVLGNVGRTLGSKQKIIINGSSYSHNEFKSLFSELQKVYEDLNDKNNIEYSLSKNHLTIHRWGKLDGQLEEIQGVIEHLYQDPFYAENKLSISKSLTTDMVAIGKTWEMFASVEQKPNFIPDSYKFKNRKVHYTNEDGEKIDQIYLTTQNDEIIDDGSIFIGRERVNPSEQVDNEVKDEIEEKEKPVKHESFKEKIKRFFR